jgi:uncharacterized membrane protein
LPPSSSLLAARPLAAAPEPTRTTPRSQPWNPTTIVCLLTLFGLGIRLYIVRGFWLDEATSGFDSRLSYGGMLRYLEHDNHPPLEYSILWGMAHTVGSSQTDLRLPSIAFGTLMIPMLYVAGRALYRRQVGLIAAAFGAVSPLAVWYSQEARMYALFMLLVTVTIWAQCRALQTDRRRYWLAWAAASTGLLWDQWFSALALATQVIFFLVVILLDRRQRPWRRPILHLGISVAAVLLTLAPILPLLYIQYRNNQATGLGFGGNGANLGTALSPYGIFNNLVWATFGYHSNGIIAALVAIWPLGILAVLVVLGRNRVSRRSNRQLLALAVAPMTLVFLASGLTSQNRSLFEVRYFIELVPALLLLLAGAMWQLPSSRGARNVIVGITLGLLTAALVLQQSDRDNPRLYGYTAAIEQINSVARPGAVILYAPKYLNVDVEYLDPRMRSMPATETPPPIALSKQIFVFGSFNFSGVSPESTDKLLSRLEQSRHLNAVFKGPNIVVWEFS